MTDEWKPTHIDVEATFDRFVSTFRGGRSVRDFLTERSKLPLNADYFFPKDNIVAELKCLEKNPTESLDLGRRTARAYAASGRTGSDFFGYLFRGEPMPADVKSKISNWVRESIRSVVKKGNRQIRATKRFLSKNAKGLLLIANDNNYGFGPDVMTAIVGDAATRLGDNHVDALVGERMA
jgi:hypothetical protein